MRRLAALLVLATIVLALPQTADACPVCFGDVDGPAARGVNNGILAMLGIVFSVQIGFVALFVGIWRRNKRLAELKESFKVIRGGRK